MTSFDDVHAVENAKVENKLKGREGQAFYEKGVFVTIEDMQAQLQGALNLLSERPPNDSELRKLAESDLVATCDRMSKLQAIEAFLVADLLQQGIEVDTTVDWRMQSIQPVLDDQIPMGRATNATNRDIG